MHTVAGYSDFQTVTVGGNICAFYRIPKEPAGVTRIPLVALRT